MTGTLKMLERLSQFYQMRHEKNSAEKMLDDLVRKDNDFRKKVANLEQEKVFFFCVLAFCPTRAAPWLGLWFLLCLLLPSTTGPSYADICKPRR